jgi:hypothetical protein
MELLSNFTSWTGYASYVVAEYDIQLRKANKVLRRISDEHTVRLKAKTVSETKALVARQADYQEAEDEVDAVEDTKLLAISIYTHLESCMKTVSRELTRRTSRNNVEERNSKYNT